MIVATAACLGLLMANPPASSSTTASTSPPGMVAYRGRWARPDEVVDLEARDARLIAARAEYGDRRATAPATAEGQRALARWCEEAGFKAEALAHFTALTRLDPDDESAQRKLGRRRHDGTWKSPAEIDAEAEEARAQARADRDWGPKIAAWRQELTEPATRDAAAKALAAIRDPRAIPALRRSFGDRVPWEQSWAVRLLGPIDSPDSSRELAGLSVFGIDEPVREAALARLLRRDPRSFVGSLIRRLRDPVQYWAQPVAGGVEATAGLRVEGTTTIVERLYRASPDGLGPFGGRSGEINRLNFDGRNQRLQVSITSPGISDAAQRARAAVVARRREDIREIERTNVPIVLANERIERALIRTTGMQLGSDSQAWSGWWADEQGYSYQSPGNPQKPVVTETIPVTYVSPAPVVSVRPISPGVHHSCFAAGTPVLSRSGARPIEDLRVGDQVLTRDQATGDLEFRPILAIFHNRPTATLRVSLGDEAITATPIHRFWLAGKGWKMARDLKAGDHVRTLEGPAEVAAVTPAEVQPVFNLEVADGHSFFVGHRRALVHDNSIVGPVVPSFDGDR